MGFLCLAIGLSAARRQTLSLLALATAACVQPLSALPVAWSIAFASLRKRSLRVAAVLLTLTGVAVADWFVPALTGQRLTILQHRTPYVLLSEWRWEWIVDVLASGGAAIFVLRSLNRVAASPFVVTWLRALCYLGLISPSVSFVLELARSGLVPLWQPMRMAIWPVFIVNAAGPAVIAMFLQARRASTLAGMAVAAQIYSTITCSGVASCLKKVGTPEWDWLLLTATMSGALVFAIQHLYSRSKAQILAMAVLHSALALIMAGGPSATSRVAKQGITHLAGWAKSATPQCAVYAFPNAAATVYPGLFRVRAERSIFVDWLSGGQSNYFPMFASMWWQRWQWQMVERAAEEYGQAGVDYIVYAGPPPPHSAPPVYNRSGFTVFQTSRQCIAPTVSQ